MVLNSLRGGSLSVYDSDTRRAIDQLTGKIDVEAALNVWETALATSWDQSLVWVHGDISDGNLLTEGGRLTAVIDFGQLTGRGSSLRSGNYLDVT
ncbi:phosphotransferase [Candidatus Neptunichlamydia sp. REUL1]|uniref:phosphotransferase n=1 Tax=Candidatus Neptunichlamydia sp. REUL1 TaxID=3064277 RepID=UPI0029312A88|nr:phosphotransferase [Candidatus Neptunochlamydia sp. REUL1]